MCVSCCCQLSCISHWARCRSRFLGLAASNAESQQSCRALRDSIWQAELRLLAFINPCNEDRDHGEGCTYIPTVLFFFSFSLSAVCSSQQGFSFFWICIITINLFLLCLLFFKSWIQLEMLQMFLRWIMDYVLGMWSLGESSTVLSSSILPLLFSDNKWCINWRGQLIGDFQRPI